MLGYPGSTELPSRVKEVRAAILTGQERNKRLEWTFVIEDRFVSGSR